MEQKFLQSEEDVSFLQRKRENSYKNKRYTYSRERRNHSSKNHIFINNNLKMINGGIDDRSPESNFSEKNEIPEINPFGKLSETTSIQTINFDENTINLMKNFVNTYEQNDKINDEEYNKVKNENKELKCLIENSKFEKNEIINNYESKINILIEECVYLNKNLKEVTEKSLKIENSLKNENDDYRIKKEEIAELYNISTKENVLLEDLIFQLTETIKKMQTEFKDKLVCVMSGKLKNENIITNLGKDFINLIKVNK